MSFQNFQQLYQFRPNILHYYGIAHSLNEWLNTINIEVNERKIHAILPFNISIFFESKKGSREMYKVLNENYVTFAAKEKWENHLNMTGINWKKIHTTCTNYSKSTKLCWFQYRTIHRILEINSLLYKMKINSNNICTFCKEGPETIEHLFWSCPMVASLWHALNIWIFEMTNIELPLNIMIILFGIYENVKLNFVKNKIILLSKYYIYRTKLQEVLPNLNALKKLFKGTLELRKIHFI